MVECHYKQNGQSQTGVSPSFPLQLPRPTFGTFAFCALAGCRCGLDNPLVIEDTFVALLAKSDTMSQAIIFALNTCAGPWTRKVAENCPF